MAARHRRAPHCLTIRGCCDPRTAHLNIGLLLFEELDPDRPHRPVRGALAAPQCDPPHRCQVARRWIARVVRAGSAPDIAPAALFLRSDAARWINGANPRSTAASKPRSTRQDSGSHTRLHPCNLFCASSGRIAGAVAEGTPAHPCERCSASRLEGCSTSAPLTGAGASFEAASRARTRSEVAWKSHEQSLFRVRSRSRGLRGP